MDAGSYFLGPVLVDALAGLGRGPVLESDEYPTAARSADPLNSFRSNMGRPEDVQATALVALAAVALGSPAAARRAADVVFEALVHPSPVVRRGAHAAAGRLPGLTSEQLVPLVMGLRDPDPAAARAAFAAFARRPEWTLTRPMWKQFLLAVRLAAQSTDAGVRVHAARALGEMRAGVPTAVLAAEANELLAGFASDIHAEVRAAVLPN